jgi:hypothetical protein
MENIGGYPGHLRSWEASRLLAFCLRFHQSLRVLGISKFVVFLSPFFFHFRPVAVPFLRCRCTTLRLLFWSRCICGGHTSLGSTLQESMATAASCMLFHSGLSSRAVASSFYFLPCLLLRGYQKRCKHANTMSLSPFVLNLLLTPHLL